jgi:hypothetical protein
MRRIPTQAYKPPSRRPVYLSIIVMMGFCWVAAFGFTLSPKQRAGHGMFDHERPQAIEDVIEKKRKADLQVTESDK